MNDLREAPAVTLAGQMTIFGYQPEQNVGILF